MVLVYQNRVEFCQKVIGAGHQGGPFRFQHGGGDWSPPYVKRQGHRGIIWCSPCDSDGATDSPEPKICQNRPVLALHGLSASPPFTIFPITPFPVMY